MGDKGDKPNILIIVADQLRYDCIGFSRKYPVKTPNIDRLAQEGMWFSNAYTPIPTCCPARQSLLSGRRVESFGALWNYNSGGLMIPAMEPREYSWPRELQSRGWRMGYVGKWHVHPKYDPIYYGFDEYVPDWQYSVLRKEKYNKSSDWTKSWSGEPDPIPVEDSRTHWQADRVIEMIEKYEQEGKPWHIRLDYNEPHIPCRPSEPYASMYKPEDIPKWGSFDEEFKNKPYIQRQQLYSWGVENYTWEDWAPIVALYYGWITQMDDAIGKVLGTLGRMGICDNTIVIFTADHGDMCGGHRMVDKHYVLYDDIVKVPLIVKWPSVVNEGAICEKFICNCLDIGPTILDILGIKADRDFHGRSFLSLLREEDIPNWRTGIVSTFNGQQFGLYTTRMIRDNKWKYIWNTTDVDELYDLENDPDELVNLIYEPSYAGLVAEYRKKLYNELLSQGDGLVSNDWMRHQLLNNRKI